MLDALRDLAAMARTRDGARLAWQLGESVRFRAQRRMNHHGCHVFVDRSSGNSELLLVVAGYKSYLWPYTLARLERFVPAGLDVCIVTAGVAPPEVGELATRNGWSWLSTTRNALALAQNLAIASHPAATLIHKLDEDVLVGEGYFERMTAGYRAVEADGRFAPGFVAPVLNVNGFSYRLFLDELGLADAYHERFGELRQACIGNRAQSDPAAALWLWKHSLPFDDMVRRFAERPFDYVPIPHRFSIGAFVMARDLWDAIGGFEVSPRGGLGHEERHLCQECMDLSRVPVVVSDVFAGHWSFGPQEHAMRAVLPEFDEQLRPSATVGATGS
jgi:hypothetical protein